MPIPLPIEMASTCARMTVAASRTSFRTRLSRAVCRKTLAMALTAGLVGCAGGPGSGGWLSTTARLENNEAARSGPLLNVDRINTAGIQASAVPFTAYIGPQRIEYQPNTTEIANDIRALRQSGAVDFDPAESVSIEFEGASVDFVLRQLLSGALGVNYVAPENLGGSITFRTESPIPKGRVLEVVRDLLARNNLVIRLINGVYHVGTQDVIENLAANSAIGRQGEETTRIVRLQRSNAAQVVALGTQIAPENVQLLTSSSPNTVVIRSNPADADAVERLVRTLSETALGEDTVAIIPLTQSEPRVIADRLTEFYASTIRGDEPSVTVLPLENQRGILVGTPDPELMSSLRLLVQQLDRSVADVSSLRIIPLTHLNAEDIAPQLSQLFGSSVEPAATSAFSQPLTDVKRNPSNTRLFPRTPTVTPLSDNEDGTGLQVASPVGAPIPAGTGPSAAEAPAATDATATGTVPPIDPGDIRIVPDTRNNTILVHSTYRVFNRMREVVAALDIPQSQVVIEATVVEVDLSDRLDSGVQFFLESNGFGGGFGIPGAGGPAEGGLVGFSGSVGNFSVNAVLTALREVTNINVISSPYLTVLNGRSARLVIGDQIPFATASQSSTNAGNVTVTQEVEILDTGVVLEITPRIFANNSVDLQVSQSVSTPVASGTGTNLTPTIATRDIQSQLLVQSGRTVLLGGLIQDRIELGESKVPGAGNLPVIGNLFRQRTNAAGRTELLVLITPRVVRASSDLEAITRQLRSALVGAPPQPAAPVTYKP